MKEVPFYPNSQDDTQCVVAVYRSILAYFLDKKMTQAQVQSLLGYKRGKAVWTLKALTEMAGMGFDIRMIEPFDYREYAEQGRAYLDAIYPEEEKEWLTTNSNILDIHPFIPDFLKTVQWEKRRPTLQDIDGLLDDGRLVFVTVNSRALNNEEGYVSHALLVIGHHDTDYIVHDPGLPPIPNRRIPRQKLWEAIGKEDSTAGVTGFRLIGPVKTHLDQYVVRKIPVMSRTYAASLIEDGKVTVNNAVIKKPSHKIHQEDIIHIDYNPASLQQIPDIELPILYEDDDCVVVNKPVGILTHSKGAFNPEATVATWLKDRLSGGLEGDRAGIVHRLDRATSGVMICAKTPEALSWLQKQFSSRKVKKTYYAVVSGHMPHNHALIDMPIIRNPKRPQTFRTGSNGKPAVTEYFVQGQNDRNSLLELQPQTGRTHQLRVHLSELGHPIVGDTLYSGKPADRLYLQATQLELTLPNRTRKVFRVTMLPSFQAMIEA